MIVPQIQVQVGLTSANPVQGSTSFTLGDPTLGQLGGTGTLGTSTVWTDITGDVRSFEIFVPSTREQGPLWNYQASTITIALDNSSGDYDPSNTAGPFFGQLSPMVPVRVLANFGPTSYPIYSGFADGWLPDDINEPTEYAGLTLSATDAFKVLAGINLDAHATLGAGEDTGARIKRILTLAGWYTSAERLKIDTGNSNLQGTTLGDSVLSLMQVAVDSELGQLYQDTSGAIVFRSRHAVLTDSRSNTVQAVFGDAPGTVQAAGTELYYSAISRANDDTRIINDVQATINGSSNLQEVSDATSVAKYLFPRVYQRSDLILQNDSDALNWAQWVVYVAKDEENRIEAITVDPAADPANLWPQVLGRVIGDRIQVWHRPPNVVGNVSPWSLTNNFGSAPSNQFTIPTTSVPLLSVGDRFQIHLSGGVLKESTTFTITVIGGDFFGNTAVTFAPSAQSVLSVGDVVTQTGGALHQDCFITGIQHNWNAADNHWISRWSLADASKYGSFLTLDNPTLGKLGSNALAF